MRAFDKDLNRGRFGELAAEYWLTGIDYDNGVVEYGVIPICNPDKSVNRIDTGAIWTYTPGKNKNKDYIVTYADGRTESHEIKTDFYSFGVENNTQYIFVEVDKAAVSNIWEVKKNSRTFIGECKGEKEGAWFHPEHCADWYHYFLPLRDWDDTGIITNNNATVRATQEEIAAFDRAQEVQEGDALLSALPGDSFMSISGKQLQAWLEKYAHIKFKPTAPTSLDILKIRLPVFELGTEIWEDDVNACLVLSCLFHRKGRQGEAVHDGMPGQFWWTKRMQDAIMEAYKGRLYMPTETVDQLMRRGITPNMLQRAIVTFANPDKQQIFAGRDRDNQYYKELYSPVHTSRGFSVFVPGHI